MWTNHCHNPVFILRAPDDFSWMTRAPSSNWYDRKQCRPPIRMCVVYVGGPVWPLIDAAQWHALKWCQWEWLARLQLAAPVLTAGMYAETHHVLQLQTSVVLNCSLSVLFSESPNCLPFVPNDRLGHININYHCRPVAIRRNWSRSRSERRLQKQHLRQSPIDHVSDEHTSAYRDRRPTWSRETTHTHTHQTRWVGPPRRHGRSLAGGRCHQAPGREVDDMRLQSILLSASSVKLASVLLLMQGRCGPLLVSDLLNLGDILGWSAAVWQRSRRCNG